MYSLVNSLYKVQRMIMCIWIRDIGQMEAVRRDPIRTKNEKIGLKRYTQTSNRWRSHPDQKDSESEMIKTRNPAVKINCNTITCLMKHEYGYGCG